MTYSQEMIQKQQKQLDLAKDGLTHKARKYAIKLAVGSYDDMHEALTELADCLNTINEMNNTIEYWMAREKEKAEVEADDGGSNKATV